MDKEKPAALVVFKKVSAVCFLTLLFGVALFLSQKYFQSKAHTNTAQQVKLEAKKNDSIVPVRLAIPIINVDALIQDVGVTANGAMGVPNNISDVGWFSPGTRPGDVGSAVIAGHFNGVRGERGVFSRLSKLVKGDKVVVKDSAGVSTTFIVRETRTFDPGYADAVFSPNDSAHLNLITCDGSWDIVKKTYTKRLVVFSDMQK